MTTKAIHLEAVSDLSQTNFWRLFDGSLQDEARVRTYTQILEQTSELQEY